MRSKLQNFTERYETLINPSTMYTCVKSSHCTHYISYSFVNLYLNKAEKIKEALINGETNLVSV